MWAKRHLFSFMSKSIDIQSNPHLAAKQAKYALKSSRLRLYTSALLLIPVSMIGVTLIASSERTPLTGRWRVILLSPAEEEAISSDLQGQKWYDAVRDILSQSSGPGPAPSILPRDDWRWTWVEQTLRRLERAITTLHDVGGYSQVYEHHVANSRQDQTLYPPPPKYPLLPRPRATTLLHEMPLRSDLDHVKSPVDPHGHQTHHVPPHALLGPPYSLLLVNKDESNAFSYGFGPGGAGGVVVYSGFLDDILKSDVPVPPPKAELQSNSIFSGIFSSSRSPSPQPEIPPGPTPEQTSKLATLLAHELSHLILSHHLETLSKGTILFPSIISIMVDTVRSFLYPLTFIVGPFFGDALDRTLRMGFDDLAKAGEACTSMHLEIEADVISARILALAGFDPNAAVSFWQERMECSPNDQGKDTPANSTGFHPVCKERIQSLKEELASWERAKERLLKTLAAGKQAQAIA
ncbi:hypothetical protein FRB99_004167 [Tulasnella sp. 403]|nr:hypothetical protein FRB99_004167 [Tulasnella sp. 403]